MANELAEQGWTVFNTNSGFPDLFCVRGGSVKLIEVKGPQEPLRGSQKSTIERLRSAGLSVEVHRLLQGKKLSIVFDDKSEKIIKAHRKSTDPIPSIAKAVNELIHKAGDAA